MTIYCTRLTYVDNYLKNTYYSCIQKHKTCIQYASALFYCKGFLFYVTCIHLLISSLTCLQIIEFCVWIQDKTKVLQSSHSRWNSGGKISKQVKIIVVYFAETRIMLEIENSTKPVREVFCKKKIRLEQTKLQYTQIQWKVTDCSSISLPRVSMNNDNSENLMIWNTYKGKTCCW